MPVSGKELASLDFANLIGGPLNAIVEAQAKSAITTANFIKEVGFDKDGKAVNVDFTYNRKNDNGSDQEFTLTMPFITMLPVPYITINNAAVEFNAKITSTTESSSDSNFTQQVDASAGGRWWFVSARVTSKTAYQKTMSSRDKEERTFDMHVRIEASNQDMPAGTERILTLLENSISEKTSHKLISVGAVVTGVDPNDPKKLTVDSADFAKIKKGNTFNYGGTDYIVEGVNEKASTLTVDEEVDSSITNKSIDVVKQCPVRLSVTNIDASKTVLTIKGADIAKKIREDDTFHYKDKKYTVKKTDPKASTLTVDPAADDSINHQSIDIVRP
jgi:hypothetical protein